MSVHTEAAIISGGIIRGGYYFLIMFKIDVTVIGKEVAVDLNPPNLTCNHQLM